MFCTRIFCFAKRITPVLRETEINNTNPLGSIPNKAAQLETTASSIMMPLKNIASINNKIPRGRII